MLLKTLFPTLHLFTAPSGQWMLCNVGQGAAGAGRRGVCATGSATGMLPDCVQTHGVDAPLTVKDQHGLGNSVAKLQNWAKQGAGHNTFATSQRRITAGAVTRVFILKEQEKWERIGVQEHVKKQFAGYMWQLLDRKNK